MKQTKILTILIIIAITITAVYAGSKLTPVTAYLNKNLKLTFNGEVFTLKESDGTVVYPLVYKNKIYLPLKAFTEKVGLTIDSDEAANTICIKTQDYLTDPKPTLMIVKKPNIYLYPVKKQDVLVKLNFTGMISTSYPTYNSQIHGWQVTAFPDGKIINKADHKEYSYLFWEGKNADLKYDLSKGFIVAGKDTLGFLQETLAKMGLTPKEYNEFIVYWLPKMHDNKYNLVTFAGKEYTDNAKLEITPQPDSILRVFMVFKPLAEKITIKAPEIKPFTRKGFTVVEWGGTELR